MSLMPNRPLVRRNRGPGAPVVPTTNTRRTPGTGTVPNIRNRPTGIQQMPPGVQAGAGSHGIPGAPAQPRMPATPMPPMTHTTAPPATAAGAQEQPSQPAPPSSQEDMYDKALRELLGSGPRSTADDEAQIQTMLQQTVGQGQADLNARLGAAGFGTSGALGAQSADMRGQAAREAANEIMGVRQGARDDYFNQVQAGLSAANADRGLDIREDAYSRYLDAMEAALGLDPQGGGDPAAGGGGMAPPDLSQLPDFDGVSNDTGGGHLPGFNSGPSQELAATQSEDDAVAAGDAAHVGDGGITDEAAAGAVDTPPEGMQPVLAEPVEHPPGSGQYYMKYGGGGSTAWVRV